MKTNKAPTKVTTSGVGETKQATIKASAKLFNFFSEQIYADKYVAIWRELVANGVDAQKVTGNTDSPIVTLPSMLDPIAKVRDFGTGMGHEFMMDKFMAFTDATTKEDSNDFIGGFGIGSKAPLAYTEQYSIKSYQEGVVRVYSVFKDETGCPAIAFLAEDETDEPDGVEVSFPVRQDDIESFNDVVVETLQYFNPLPKLENTELELSPVKYDSSGKGWGMIMSRGNSQIIIGGVAYPLSTSSMTYTQKENYPTVVNFASFGVDIFLGIGEANIALSREHVTHDDDLYAKLEKVMTEVSGEFGAQIAKVYEECDTEWDAKVIYSKTMRGLNYHSDKAKVTRQYATYGGEKLVGTISRPDPEDYPVLAIAYGNFAYQDNVRNMPTTMAEQPKFRSWDPTATFPATTFDRIVIDDGPNKPMLRVRQAIKTHDNEKIFFLRDHSDEKDIDWDGFMKELGSPPKSMICKLSDYEPLKVVRQLSSSGLPIPKRKFKVYLGPSSPSYSNGRSQDYMPAGGGLYIRMDNFDNMSTAKDIAVAKAIQPVNIAWLNKTDFKASGVLDDPDWLSVDEAIAKVKREYRSKHKRLAWAEAYFHWQLHADDEFDSDLADWSQMEKFPKRGPLVRLNNLRVEFEDVTTVGDSNIRREMLGVKFHEELKKIIRDAKLARKQHPFIFELAKIDTWSAWKLSDEFKNNLF